MTSADPTGAAQRPPDRARPSSPPPPLYQPSDEISLDDPIAESPPAPSDFVRPLATFKGEEPLHVPARADQRPGRPFRAFWLAFAANSSASGIVVGALLFSVGMSLRQSLLAAVIGLVLAGALAAALARIGRRSGRPVIDASATAFGVRGNLLPVVIVAGTRVAFGGVLLWLFASFLARVGELNGIAAGGPSPESVIVVVAAAASGSLAATGYRGLVLAQRILTPVAAAGILWFVITTLPAVDLRIALTIGDGPGLLVVSGAVIVFVVAGLLLAPVAGDVARFQTAGPSGITVGVWTALGSAVPTLIVVAVGTVLAASAPEMAGGLLTTPVDAVADLLPPWYPIPLAIAVGAGSVSAAALSIYSGGLALTSAGHRVALRPAVALLSVASAGVAVLLSLAPDGTAAIDLVTTLAVPLAAWIGVLLGASVTQRDRDDDARSIRWVPQVTLLAATVAGFGWTSASTGWLSWQGYLFPFVGDLSDGALAASDLGIVIALLVAAGASVLRPRSGPRVRRQGSHRGQ